MMIDAADHSLKFGPARRDLVFAAACDGSGGRTVSIENGRSAIGSRTTLRSPP